MPISALMQQAFVGSSPYNQQVDAVVVQQALIKAENGGAPDALDSVQRELLARVVRSPGNYGFTTAIVADANYFLTYDAWATDPASADVPILSGVQRYFTLMTGFVPPVPA